MVESKKIARVKAIVVHLCYANKPPLAYCGNSSIYCILSNICKCFIISEILCASMEAHVYLVRKQ